MSSYKLLKSPRSLNVHPGEVVCVMDANRNNYALILEKEPARPSAVIALNHFPVSTPACPVSRQASVQDTLQRWLKGFPDFSVRKISALFGLEEVLTVSLPALGNEMRYRLLVLKAILEKAAFIEFVAPWRITGFSDLLQGARTFAKTYSRYRPFALPAFIVYDPGYLPGVALLSDRLLAARQNEVIELLPNLGA